MSHGIANCSCLLDLHIENDSETVSRLNGKEFHDRLVISITGIEMRDGEMYRGHLPILHQKSVRYSPVWTSCDCVIYVIIQEHVWIVHLLMTIGRGSLL